MKVSNFLRFSGASLVLNSQAHGQPAFIICQRLSVNWRCCNKVTDVEKEDIRGILTWLSVNFHDRLVLSGTIDEKAKLIDYQKGTVAPLRLTNARQNDFDIEVSLVFALAKQFEDLAGSLAHSVLTYDEYEVIIMGLSPGSVLYIVCTPGSSSEIIDGVTRLVEDVPALGTPTSRVTAEHSQDIVRSEWSGQ